MFVSDGEGGGGGGGGGGGVTQLGSSVCNVEQEEYARFQEH